LRHGLFSLRPVNSLRMLLFPVIFAVSPFAPSSSSSSSSSLRFCIITLPECVSRLAVRDRPSYVNYYTSPSVNCHRDTGRARALFTRRSEWSRGRSLRHRWRPILGRVATARERNLIIIIVAAAIRMSRRERSDRDRRSLVTFVGSHLHRRHRYSFNAPQLRRVAMRCDAAGNDVVRESAIAIRGRNAQKQPERADAARDLSSFCS